MPQVGEDIRLCLPFEIPGPGSLLSRSALTNTASSNYHTVFVKHVHADTQKQHLGIVLWVTPAFSKPDGNGLSSTSIFHGLSLFNTGTFLYRSNKTNSITELLRLLHLVRLYS